MSKKTIRNLGSILITIISFLNFEVNAGINKKDFKSKTASELIDVLNNEQLLEKKVMEKIDKKLMCKLQLFIFKDEIKDQKLGLEMQIKLLEGTPYGDQTIKDGIRNAEQFTIRKLKEIDKYCN